VGYAGGTTLNPKYHKLGDHTETLQLDFDNKIISYSQLLDIFWREHNPEYMSLSHQYRSMIFYHNEAQRAVAITSRERERRGHTHPVVTDIVPLAVFYLAEDYHQKYYLRGESRLMEEMRRYYQTEEGLVNSTAAARLNGLVAGYGDFASESDIDKFGLSENGRAILLKIARRSDHTSVSV